MISVWRSPDGLQELQVGETITVRGEQRRIIAITIEEATEDDEELGLHIGDLVTTLELVPKPGPPEEQRHQCDEVCIAALGKGTRPPRRRGKVNDPLGAWKK